MAKKSKKNSVQPADNKSLPVRKASPKAKHAKEEEENAAPSISVPVKQFLPVGIAVLVFLVLWFKPFDVRLQDPWYKGIPLIDSARKVTDPNLRNKLLDEAGKLMAEQVRLHPYHARVHYLYGYYWYQRQNLDSVIAQEKEAIRLGTGGVVNQVEYDAQNMMNSALINKAMSLCAQNKFDDAFALIENAKSAVLANNELIKFRGMIFSRENKNDSAFAYFSKYRRLNPGDSDNLTNIGIYYAQKNMRDSALSLVDIALRSNPANQNAQYLKKQLEGAKHQ